MTTITIASGSSVDLTTTLATGENIEFLAGAGTLTIESSALENTTYSASGTTITGIGDGLVYGFAPGDSIVVRDLATDYAIFDHAPGAAAQNTSVAGALSELLIIEKDFGDIEVITISASGAVTDNLNLVGDTPAIGSYASEIEQALFGTHAQTADLFITLSADATTDTLADATITTDGTIVICYLRGTRILTPTGERTIESLKPGDLVISHSGGARPVKWIGVQSYNARFVASNRERLPVRIAAGALAENLPLRDLYVSPGHSMLLGNVLVLARNLANGVTITQPWRNEDMHYYLIELETHDCVIAEGVWAETYADAPGLRNQFHNAAEFYARFPGHAAPEALRLYAPRPESGPLLTAALQPVLARANITPGPLRGYVDTINDRIEGWALDEAHPHFPVLVEIFAGDTKIGEALAHEYRADLAASGLNNGFCKFSLPLPADLSPTARTQLRATRAADGAPLQPSLATRRAA